MTESTQRWNDLRSTRDRHVALLAGAAKQNSYLHDSNLLRPAIPVKSLIFAVIFARFRVSRGCDKKKSICITIARRVDYLRVSMSQFDMRCRKRTRFRGNARLYRHRSIRGFPFPPSCQAFQTFLSRKADTRVY